MSVKGKGLLLAAGVLGSILAASPVLAQSHGGGGGHSGGGGGGGHFSGGGGAHMGGGGGRAAPSAHFAAPGRSYAGGGYVGRGGAVYSRGGAGYSHGGYAGRPAVGNHYYAGRPGYGGGGRYPGSYWHGYSTGAYWRGGYWGGGYWPRAYYGSGFSWFLPVLPLAYATYWWSGQPYYYANDVYYTYSPDYSGYVATDPPPVSNEQSDSSAPAAQGEMAPPSGSAQVFMYPKNGQSAEQQTQDRTECQAWATQQAGSPAQNGPDYNRAMVACVEGRGYSAR